MIARGLEPEYVAEPFRYNDGGALGSIHENHLDLTVFVIAAVFTQANGIGLREGAARFPGLRRRERYAEVPFEDAGRNRDVDPRIPLAACLLYTSRCV